MTNYNRNTPYNDLPLLPPQVDLETRAVLRKTITASRALAQLNGILVSLPNPGLFVDSIYIQEAKASSEVENIITTSDELYRSVAASRTVDHYPTKEVLNCKEALWLGMAELAARPFITTNLCIKLVQCIKRNKASIRNTPGTTLKNALGEVMYTPPSGEDTIREKMANLERFINEENAHDPLIKMAVMHYQFEAIHPFSDGNGRTGRILLLLFLKQSGLLQTPAVYFSEYVMKHRNAYYTCLRNVTEKGDWESYLLYMLNMVEETSLSGVRRLNAIINLMERTADEIKEQLPKVYSKDLIDVLFKLPYTKRQHLIDAGLGTLKTVGNYLNDLESQGFLRSVRVGKEKLYLNHRLLDILERY